VCSLHRSIFESERKETTGGRIKLCIVIPHSTAASFVRVTKTGSDYVCRVLALNARACVRVYERDMTHVKNFNLKSRMI
jgi:hypothetical protein